MTNPTREDALATWRQMLLIRRFEEAAAKAYAMGSIQGFCHLYIGQEAVAVGAISALRADDVVYTSYRDHGHALAKGMSSRALMAELFGRVDGCCKGLGGSMHLFDVDAGIWGGYGIVGGHVPLATGTAFAFKYRSEDRVVLCFMGDGATNQGVFFEAMQLAELWDLPVIYIVENNHYAMGTPLERQTPVKDLTLRAQAFGIEADRLLDTDVFAVRDRVAQAVELARTETKPTFLEIETYRYRGHSMSDPAKYRSKEEVDKQKERDPLKALEQRLRREYEATDEELDAIESEVKAEVADAVEYAGKSPWPEPIEARRTTYTGGRETP